MAPSSLIALLVLLLILAAVVFKVVYWPQIRLNRIHRKKFADSWLEIIQRRLPFYAKLPTNLQLQLQNFIKVFLNDKKFVGCAGLEIDDEIRVTVAAQACLLLLNRRSNQYGKLQSILVYPSTFVATRQVRDDLGLVSTKHTAMLGESWSQGKVVLAWDNVESGVCNLYDGQNVVLHEFAHQLDSESGATNGAPLLRTRGAYKSWAQVFSQEFEELQQQVSRGQPSLIDHYGATNPAEFFAVATETFFECPQQMRRNHSELYQELASFYRVDPSSWLE
ncbi:MAG: zinc-dependent peptidase [Proteobacteria bacterium]|nr:zinc-dependent peptidase [Pseudomonadota bacterium]